MRTQILKASVLLMGALGIFVGYRLSGMSNLQPYKLRNIIGLFYNLLAVFVLSEVLVSSASWKKFCVEWIALASGFNHLGRPDSTYNKSGQNALSRHELCNDLCNAKLPVFCRGDLGRKLTRDGELA